MSFLDINHLSKDFLLQNETLSVLRDVDLHIAEGDMVSIVGGSGCGKSTLLRIIAGLDAATTGSVTLNGKAINGPNPDIGMIFQEPRLFDWATVAENIAFGLPENTSKSDKKELAQKYINLTGLTGFEKALPKQLSGGMKQRVNIARSLIGHPKILLLDEPFGALDAFTKITMQQEILQIWQDNRVTMLLVTHDIEEAVFLGHEVVVMSPKPGVVKNKYKIDLPIPRDRTTSSFAYYRNRVFSEFFEDKKLEEEFII